MMNPFDETPPLHPNPGNGSETSEHSEPATTPSDPLLGDSLAYSSPPLEPSISLVPAVREDLRISWSWVHFLVFLVFTLASLLAVQTSFIALYAPHRKMTADQLQEYLLSKPQVTIGSTIVIYAAILFFLYVTLALLRGQPFWSSLGWRKLPASGDGQRKNPLIFLFAGCGLFILVFALTSVIKPPENIPIEEVFKYKQTAILFVAMAVLVAPLAEETIFRGYLYPMFARWFGVGPSIVVTGVLFGLLHGPQLGGAKSLIAVMSFVGIVFTFVRARTGSVFASYLMHLGYNSLIGISLLLSTHGFTQMPTNH